MDSLYFLVFCLMILFVILWGMLRDDMHDDWDKPSNGSAADTDRVEDGDT